MYEYIASFERWKNVDKNYGEKYSRIKNFVEGCNLKCSDNFECQSACKKPIVDIERFNIGMIKKLSVDVYDICASKSKEGKEGKETADLTSELNKMKICVDNLYRDNELIVKKETIERMDDMIKFLNL
jgi:hypothetical protein